MIPVADKKTKAARQKGKSKAPSFGFILNGHRITSVMNGSYDFESRDAQREDQVFCRRLYAEVQTMAEKRAPQEDTPDR